MSRHHLPPPTTILLSGALILGGLTAPFVLKSPDISPLAGEPAGRSGTVASSDPSSFWPGPRPETKREILIAPLFTEDRKLPVPFSVSPPPEEPIVAEAPPEPPPVITEEIASPENPPIETVSEELEQTPESEDTEQSTQPAEPLILPELRLLGTFIVESKGIARALLIETKEGAEETWVNENGFYEDWILTIVSPEAVRLVGGDESQTLELWYEEEPASDDEQEGQDQQVIGVEGNFTSE